MQIGNGFVSASTLELNTQCKTELDPIRRHPSPSDGHSVLPVTAV